MTSCLHAFSVEPFKKDRKEWARFGIHPHQYDTETEALSEAEVIDSGGHKEKRYVITTDLVIANQRWSIKITLTNRENTLFRLLLGRTAMKQ